MTTGQSFLLLINQQLYHQALLVLFFSLLDCTPFEYLMKTDVLDQPHHAFLRDNDILIRLNPWHTTIFYQCLVASLLDRVMHSFFVSLLLLVFCIDGQNFTATMKCVPVHFLVLFVIPDALCNTSFLYYIPKFQKGYCL